MNVLHGRSHSLDIKGLQKFLYEFTSEYAIGPEGYLTEKGFIPLDDRGRKSARDSALSPAPIVLPVITDR